MFYTWDQTQPLFTPAIPTGVAIIAQA